MGQITYWNIQTLTYDISFLCIEKIFSTAMFFTIFVNILFVQFGAGLLIEDQRNSSWFSWRIKKSTEIWKKTLQILPYDLKLLELGRTIMLTVGELLKWECRKSSSVLKDSLWSFHFWSRVMGWILMPTI